MGIFVPLPDENDEIKGNLQPRSNFERKPLLKGRIQWAIEQTLSMRQACVLVGCDYKTFRKWSKIYGLWDPNQAGNGISKKRKNINTDNIIYVP
jgi:hypothetical protein